MVAIMFSKKRPTIGLAPMAGISDLIFRNICRQFGADYAISEMVASKQELWQSVKSTTRNANSHEATPRIVQLLGTDPQEIAAAAIWQTQKGAEAIDLNMGCPAKKVCKVAAGAALMAHPDKVKDIFYALREATQLPISVKIRTGTNSVNKNALEIALLAEEHGFNSISIHGRTSEDKFKGQAEYETIRRVKQAVKIPVIANGDISSPEKAKFVLKYTSANGLLIGRSAQGYPWIFREIQHYLATNTHLVPPTLVEFEATMLQHLEGLYQIYGTRQGVRIARKHIGWYSKHLPRKSGSKLRKEFNRLNEHQAQINLVKNYFKSL